MYHALNWARKEDKMAGFVHVPLLESQKADPTLPKVFPHMDDAVALKSLRRVIEFSLDALEGDAPELKKSAARGFPPPSPKHDGPRLS
jgi:pyrrolidone-carboxylate peptidase